MSAGPTGSQASEGGEAPVQKYVFSPDLVTMTDSRPAEAEAIRTVRTHVIARHLNDGRRGLVVCGPRPGVGCTFTAVNLAVAMSQVGVSTLLIDADLRTSAVQNFIRPEGSVHRLSDAVSPTDWIHHEVLPNLSVLFSEGLMGSAAEGLGGEAFRRFMDRCLRDFELTVVDAPAVSENSDALRVASVMGYALIVARMNVSFLKDVERLAKDLQDDGARVVGAVLNQA